MSRARAAELRRVVEFQELANAAGADRPDRAGGSPGVIGGGTYSIGANSGQNSGNSGRLAGGAITDNTAVPTVVTSTNTTTTNTITPAAP
jgi:hypothetical protein